MSLLGITIGIILIKFRKKTGLIEKQELIKFKKNDFTKITLIVLALIVVSILIYNGVQG
jgi:amino acid transporter